MLKMKLTAANADAMVGTGEKSEFQTAMKVWYGHNVESERDDTPNHTETKALMHDLHLIQRFNDLLLPLHNKRLHDEM